MQFFMRRSPYFSGAGYEKPWRATDVLTPSSIASPPKVYVVCLLSTFRFCWRDVHFLLHRTLGFSRNGRSHPEARELHEAIRVRKESSHAPSTEPKHPLPP
jgi:hypothetical protein